MSADLGAWPLLLLAVAATYVWRGLGVLCSQRIDPRGAAFQWVSCVSYAMLAGLIARMIVLPIGSLVETPLSHRLAAMALAFAVYYLSRSSLLAGVSVGAGTLIAFSALTLSDW